MSAPGAAHAAAVLAGLASPVSALENLHAAVALRGVQQGDPSCYLQHLPALGVQVPIILCKPTKSLEEMLNISHLIGPCSTGPMEGNPTSADRKQASCS